MYLHLFQAYLRMRQRQFIPWVLLHGIALALIVITVALLFHLDVSFSLQATAGTLMFLMILLGIASAPGSMPGSGTHVGSHAEELAVERQYDRIQTKKWKESSFYLKVLMIVALELFLIAYLWGIMSPGV